MGIPVGNTVALVGDPGTGKTTFLLLFFRQAHLEYGSDPKARPSRVELARGYEKDKLGNGITGRGRSNFTFEPDYARARHYVPRGGERLFGGQELGSVPRVSGKEKKNPGDGQHDSEEGS